MSESAAGQPDARPLSLVVAVADNGVIGNAGDLPWRLSGDLVRFKQLTMGHTLVMGRKTYESIGRPLPGRTTIVLTTRGDYDPGHPDVRIAHSLDEAAAQVPAGKQAFVVGGAEIYRLTLPHAARLYYTQVHASPAGDTHFPAIDWTDWQQLESIEYPADAKNQHACTWQVWERRSFGRFAGIEQTLDMTAISSAQLVSVADYLAGELDAECKHEYLGGIVYAMAGGTNAHNLIAGNIFGILYARLQGRPCRPFNSDTKVRVQSSTQTRFYYPDASVVCKPNSMSDTFQDQPVVIAEVLSRKTRRTDEGEKREAYLSIPSLAVYLLVEQELARVTIYRRGDQGFTRQVIDDPNATIPLSEISAELSFADIYRDVDFTPEPSDEE